MLLFNGSKIGAIARKCIVTCGSTIGVAIGGRFASTVDNS